MDVGLVRRIEDASLRAWPALETEHLDRWQLRSSQGFTKRANSVQPFGPSTASLTEKVEACEAWYSARDQSSIFRLTPFSDETLDAFLERRGYVVLDPTDVLFTGLSSSGARAPGVELLELGLEEWLATYASFSATAPPTLAPMGAILQVTGGRKVLGAFRSSSHSDLVACGLGVLHDDLLGIFDVITVASQRRRGYGAALMAGLIGWGIARGAAHAYLQVVRSNAPAMALYERLGFTKAYEYWYRVRGSTS